MENETYEDWIYLIAVCLLNSLDEHREIKNMKARKDYIDIQYDGNQFLNVQIKNNELEFRVFNFAGDHTQIVKMFEDLSYAKEVEDKIYQKQHISFTPFYSLLSKLAMFSLSISSIEKEENNNWQIIVEVKDGNLIDIDLMELFIEDFYLQPTSATISR